MTCQECLVRQQFIDKYGSLFDMRLVDEWAGLFVDSKLFWQAQYARCYAKELFDKAVARDKEGAEALEEWAEADNAEIFAKLLENGLIARSDILTYLPQAQNSVER
jgi:hypothetical protein